jgi:hypothetical protein
MPRLSWKTNNEVVLKHIEIDSHQSGDSVPPRLASTSFAEGRTPQIVRARSNSLQTIGTTSPSPYLREIHQITSARGKSTTGLSDVPLCTHEPCAS